MMNMTSILTGTTPQSVESVPPTPLARPPFTPPQRARRVESSSSYMSVTLIG